MPFGQARMDPVAAGVEDDGGLLGRRLLADIEVAESGQQQS
jgi:hypothetical protein